MKAKGNLTGLKPKQKKDLDRLFERRVSQDMIVTPDFAKALCAVSSEIGRQVGALIDRKGHVFDVFVGDAKGLEISDFGRYRAGRSRLRGLRLVHTHLDGKGLNNDDLTDLALLRLDVVSAVEVLPSGLPGKVFTAHLLPFRANGKICEELPPVSVHDLGGGFKYFIEELEAEIDYSIGASETGNSSKRAILVHVCTRNLDAARESMEELQSLADAAGVEVVESIIQKRREIDSRFVMGKGKIKELLITSMEKNANLIVFDGQLSASQMQAVSDAADIDVIDRTQMILDIFARRARTSEGKLQVRLAQLRYSLPRLVMKDDFLSRITGGTGGLRSRGPGETKLEILRRRIRDSIASLEKELEDMALSRKERRKRRDRGHVPVASIVGYTNAGKSTLLNALTSSDVYVEDKMFATLDTSTKRAWFADGRDLVITDTVGFIRDLPEDLLAAFRSTLEEMRDSDLLIHLFDMSSPSFRRQMESVDAILRELALDNIPMLLVGNKSDLISPEEAAAIAEETGCIVVSARNRDSLAPLVSSLEGFLDDGGLQ